MDKEVRILNQEQLDAYTQWMLDKDFQYQRHLVGKTLELYGLWREANPCPLPTPVKVLTDFQIINMARLKAYDVPDYELGFEAGYNACLSDLGLK